MASKAREIVTLQLGNYANHVGAHFWNLQEHYLVSGGSGSGSDGGRDGHYNEEEIKTPEPEIAYETLFRVGETPKGEPTYTPRLVALDLKGSVNARSQVGELYGHGHDTSTAAAWGGDVAVHETRADEPSAYHLQLEGQEVDREAAAREALSHIRGWSDYMHTHLHPRSLHIVNTYAHGDESRPFDTPAHGREAYARPEVIEPFQDALRLFMEEAEHAQGFQLLSDTCDGFGGVTTAVVEHLADEYEGKTIAAFCLTPPTADALTKRQSDRRVASSATTLDFLRKSCNMVVPLSVCDSWTGEVKTSARSYTYAPLDPSSFYVSAGILAAAVDTAMLPARLRGDAAAPITHLSAALTSISTITPLTQTLQLPLGTVPGALAPSLMDLCDTSELLKTPKQGSTSLTPGFELQHATRASLYTVRGITPALLKPTAGVLMKRAGLSPLARCDTAREMVSRFLGGAGLARQFRVFEVQRALRTRAPFPPLLGPGSPEAASLTGLHDSPDAVGVLESLHAALRSVDKVVNCETFALDNPGLLEETQESLLCLAEDMAE